MDDDVSCLLSAEETIREHLTTHWYARRTTYVLLGVWRCFTTACMPEYRVLRREVAKGPMGTGTVSNPDV